MNSALMFLLILDFSGSMYQKVNDQVKYLILRENVRALNQGLSDEAFASRSAILSFGLNPKKKCDDFTYTEVQTKDISTTVNKYLPGAFSKTPLGESIRRGTDISIENKVKKIVIFSDGADSCDKDPCNELIKANDKLKAANFKMDIKFIGINLTKNDPKFECFRNNKLSNVNIDFSNIGDSFDVQNALQEASKDVGGISLQNVRSPWGILRVKGAPATVKFKAQAQKAGIKNEGRDSWYGSYRSQLKGSKYIISANYPGTKKLTVWIDPEQEREILWSDFFKDEKSQLKYTRSTFSVMLVPAAGTKESHRSVTSILIEGLFEAEAHRDQKIPFGEWSVVPLSPPWLKDMIGEKLITLKPESSLKVNFVELLDLEWIKNPDSQQQWAISIEEPPKKEESSDDEPVVTSVSATAATSAPQFYVRPADQKTEGVSLYFIQTGVESLPVPRGAKVNWIKSNIQ